MQDLTLIVSLGTTGPTPLPPGFQSRTVSRPDLEELAGLYFDAYEPGVASETLDEALSDIEASFGGQYGEFLFEASPVVEHGDRIVAAIMVVHRAPWQDVPDCPFIIELFTAKQQRRLGLGRHLLTSTMDTLRDREESAVALRVSADNGPAVRLYKSLGFLEFPKSASN